jgi:predicted nucleotidyltransferase
MKTENFAIKEIRLFGSRARGDATTSSDLDVLCIVDTQDKERVNHNDMVAFIQNLTKESKQDISVYSEQRIRKLFSTGHLFAWHLYFESKLLWPKDDPSLINSFGRPSSYVDHIKDAQTLAEIASEANSSLQQIDGNIVYDLGVLYVCLRNIALIASVQIQSKPVFGPFSPQIVKVPGLPFPFTNEEYGLTIACRHAVTRGEHPPYIEKERAMNIAFSANSWVRNVANWISGEKS